MKNTKGKVWIVLAAIVLLVTGAASAGLLVKVAGLNILPMKYLVAVIVAIALVLLLIALLFFVFPIKKEKKVAKYVIRTIAMLLALTLLAGDVLGIQMVNKFEETMSNLTEGDKNETVKVEEFVIGLYVRAEDKAETLEDAKRYDIAYSLSYDRNNVRRGISEMEAELDRNLKLEEYNDIFEMVDKVLAKEKDAFILSEAYFDIMEDQEGYEDISSKIKCIHTCVVTIETEIVEREETPFDITKDTFIIYVSGHDTNYAAKRANSDVNIIAVVNPTTKQVLLINTPRDSYVPISVSEDGALDKLTHCGVYGVQCSMDTLGALYDIDINYYAQLNFTGFKRLVDALGGIEVYSEKEIYTTNEGIHFVKGINYVNGEEALAFVRERKKYGSDRYRGKHQMAVIKGIIGKMSSGALLMNYNGILESMGNYFKTSVSQEELSSIVKMQLDDLATWNVQMYAVDGTGDNQTSYSLPNLKTYVMRLNQATVDHAKTLIEMVYDGEIIEESDLTVPTQE